MSGRHVSDLHAHLGFWLRFVSNHVSGRFRKLVEAAGVSVSEWVALRELYGAERTTAATLRSSLGMTKGAISKLIDRLETKALARRTPDPNDRRAQTLELTPAGKALVPRLAKLADENDAHFFGRLASGKYAALLGTLRQLVEMHGLTQVPLE